MPVRKSRFILETTAHKSQEREKYISSNSLRLTWPNAEQFQIGEAAEPDTP